MERPTWKTRKPGEGGDTRPTGRARHARGRARTRQELEEDRKAFLANGGKVTRIPHGATGIDTPRQRYKFLNGDLL